MRRTKACGSSVEVKQVIAALCRILAASGLQHVPAPETFRRAKFAGVGEEDQLLQLLSNILLAAGVVGPELTRRLKGECIKVVGVGLWQCGYYADWMYRREERSEDGRSFSSRDLLLALGWLLAAGTLEKLVTQQVERLESTLLSSVPGNPHISPALQMDSASLRRLHWLTGSLRHQGRTLLSMLRERTCMLHAVLSSCDSSTALPSSDADSAALKQDCVYIRQLCDLLEAYINWKQVETVYWTWMDSVVDYHVADLVIERPTRVADRSPKMCHHEKRGLEELEEMLLRLPTTQDGHRSDRVADKDRRVEEKRQDWSGASSSPPLPSSLSSPSHLCRVSLQPEKSERRLRCPAEGATDTAESSAHFPASQAAEMLHDEEALLLERRDRRRLTNRMRLQELIGRLEELVLIPP